MLALVSDLILGLILLYIFRQAFDYFSNRRINMYRKRLRTVYELLETGNNKKVISEVDKLIADTQAPAAVKDKKRRQHAISSEPGYDEQVTLVIGRALKCLALVRTGKRVEGDVVMADLLDTYTTDENALQVIMQYCKETHQADKIAYFYERAVKKYEETRMAGTSEHEELLTSLFYAYARLRDFGKQQQIALKLYKQTNNMMYCFWNAASYVMMSEGVSGPELTPKEQQTKDMYLVLAEKILGKAYQEKKMEYNGEFLLYLNILEGKKKFSESLEIVNAFDEKENASKIGQTDFKIRKKIAYFKQMKKWSALRFLCEQFIDDALNNQIDDWLVYATYLDSLIELYKEQEDSELKQTLVVEALEFFERLIVRIEDKKTDNPAPKAQSPYLGRLQLVSRLIGECGVEKAKYLEKVKVYFEGYFKQFVAKPGFYLDLIFFKEFMVEMELQEFILERLRLMHEASKPFKTVKCIYTCISYYSLHRHFGHQTDLSNEKANELAVKLEELYAEAIPFGKEMLPTSMQYADELLIMAIHVRYEMIQREGGDNKGLVKIVGMLKHGLQASPSNYQFKLLLLNVYSQLGAYDALHEMYKSMDIKNIQNYSTANLLLIHNIRLGSILSSIGTYATIGHFFLSNLFDMSNFLVHCYKYGSFLKAVEIFSFINTIRRSLTLNLCLANFMSINFIMQSTNLAPTHTETTMSSGSEDELQDFKTLQTTVGNHLKEISNVSRVFDQATGLLPDSLEELTKVLLDHHDREVLYNWDPTEQNELGCKQYEVVVTEQKCLLKLRNLMIRYMNVFLDANLPGSSEKDKLNSSTQQSMDIYKEKLLAFDYNLDYTFDSSNKSDEEYFDSKLKIQVTKSFYMKRWSQLGLDKFVNVFIRLSSDLSNANFIEFLSKQKATDNQAIDQYLTDAKATSNKLKSELKQLCGIFAGDFNLCHVSRLLESVSAALEAISFVIVLLTMCLSNEVMKPVWSEKVKKSKKKKGIYAQNSPAVDGVFSVYENLCQLVNHVQVLLAQEVCVKVGECANKACGGEFPEIGRSYEKSFEEMSSIFAAKLKYLVKFAEKTNVDLESGIDALKIN